MITVLLGKKWMQCSIAYLCAGDDVADVYCEYVSNDGKGVEDRGDYGWVINGLEIENSHMVVIIVYKYE